MSDNDSGDWFWSFITGIALALTFRLVWWLIKVTWRLLVWAVRALAGLAKTSKGKRAAKTLEEADALSVKGRGDEAIPMIQRVLDSGDQDAVPTAWYSMGLALETCERWDEAVEAYGRAAATGDTELAPLARLGMADATYLGKQDRAASVAMYRQLAVPEDQGFADYSVSVGLSRQAMLGLASALYEGGQLTEADELCARLSRAGGFDAAKAAVGRARIAAAQGRSDEAVALVDGLSDADMERLVGLRHPLVRFQSFAEFRQGLLGESRELAAGPASEGRD